MKYSFMKRGFAQLLMLFLLLPMFSVQVNAEGNMEIWRERPCNFDEASDVSYVMYGDYIANWGVRGEHATFLTGYAARYYTGEYAYENLCANRGEADVNDTPSSPLYHVLSDMMNAKATAVTTYNGTRDLFKYTDCMLGDYNHISSFYSSIKLNGEWDSAKTWNREHTWPNSKIDNDEENDIMMLRPTSVQENSTRENLAYGESSGYYDPNSESKSSFNLHGDCARILLYTYVRWGAIKKMWGSDGVIENLDVLLKWIEEDPVDTWEMGRNDAVESIIGVRNVFVDYPELSWLLFDQEIPENYVSPSSVSQESNHFYMAVVTDPTCTENGYTTYECPACGSIVIADETAAIGHKDDDHDSHCDICNSYMPAEGKEFRLFTDELSEGDYLIECDGMALKASNTISPKRLDYEEVTESATIFCDNEAIVFHIAREGDYWTILNAETGLYVGGNGLKNQAGMMEGGTDKTLWTANMQDGKFEFVNKYNSDAGVNCYLRQNGYNGWACYSTGTGSPLTLYKQVETTPQGYTVTWLNDDGTVLETDENVEPGSKPSYDGPVPIKVSDSENTYIFAGWDKDSDAKVTGDITFTAVFDSGKSVVTSTPGGESSTVTATPEPTSAADGEMLTQTPTITAANTSGKETMQTPTITAANTSGKATTQTPTSTVVNTSGKATTQMPTGTATNTSAKTPTSTVANTSGKASTSTAQNTSAKTPTSTTGNTSMSSSGSVSATAPVNTSDDNDTILWTVLCWMSILAGAVALYPGKRTNR